MAHAKKGGSKFSKYDPPGRGRVARKLLTGAVSGDHSQIET
jgi:hypothetical protein